MNDNFPHLTTLLPLEKRPQALHHLPKPLPSAPDDPLPDPRRQLPLDPRRPIAAIQQQDTRIVPLMPDGPPDTLVYGPHARVLVILPRGRLARVGTRPRRRRGPFDVLELGFPGSAPGVGEGEADDDDAAAEGVGEVDSFGQLAADDGEEEAAAVGGDGMGV